MPKQALRIEVVRSNFKHISSMSEQSARDIVATLRNHYDDVRMTNVDTFEDLEALIERKPDMVFAGIYFVRDEARGGAKVWLTDALEANGIAYTGSGKNANRLSLNKHLAKQHMIERGIHTASFMFADRAHQAELDASGLTFPLFVKPSNKSGGQGVDEFSIVHTPAQLNDKVRWIHTEHHTDALIEEYLPGREFSIAVIAGPNDTFTAMPLELVAAEDKNGDRIRSQVVKSTDSEDMNPVTDPIEHAVVGQFAIDAFRALGGNGYGRVDIRFNANGIPFFLEANHIPSLIQIDSSFLRAYEMTIGKNYEAMILDIVQLGLTRTAPAHLRELAI